MSLRVILAPLFGSDADRSGLAAAVRIADRFQGHLIGLHVRPDPADIVPVIGEGISPAIVDELTHAAQAESDRRAGVARQQFEAAGADAPGAGRSGTEWLDLGGSPPAVVARLGRVADLLALTGSEADDGQRRRVIEAALLNTGRPLLLVPAGWTADLGHSVAIAWNGRAEAARAVALALPLLAKAHKICIMTAETARTTFEASAELATYLERHGLSCERQRVTLATEPVGEALLRQARDLAADLVVTGGYGRSRLAELVLGGVTRHLLTHLERPLLLAH